MKIGFLLPILGFCSAMLLAGAGYSADELEEARKAIDRGNATWIEAFRKSDAQLLASVFDEEGAILSSNGSRTDGREAIEKGMSETMKRLGPTETTIETLNVWLEGDIAYETGKYTYRFKREGQDVISSGKYVVVWKLQADGGWKILRDIGLPD